jgi:hypothetical protein
MVHLQPRDPVFGPFGDKYFFRPRDKRFSRNELLIVWAIVGGFCLDVEIKMVFVGTAAPEENLNFISGLFGRE